MSIKSSHMQWVKLISNSIMVHGLWSMVFLLLLNQQALCNNIQVSNVRLTAQNTTDDFTMVEFDITWENSWRYSNGPANWDAAWIFVKYRIGAGGQWQHAWLNNTGHIVCGNAAMANGLLNPELVFNSSTNPSLGVFFYRAAQGTGTFSCQDVQLRWNYGNNSVPDNAQVDVKVFAIEMVYIPQGSFYVGSGGTESGAFYKYPTSTVPYFITSEAAITIGTSTNNLYYQNTSGESGDQSGPLPAAFPKGFNAFYAMKYEISQQGYVDFLNTLTRTQQIARVGSNITGTAVVNQWVMSNTPSSEKRSYIKSPFNIPPQPGPVDFLVDQNDNNIPNDINDGQYLACGYLSYGDVSAYLDWSALRLITEFEFEKCGRGNAAPVPNEFAWGNNVYYTHTGLNNISMATETPNNPISNVAFNSNNGPLRIGIFARSNSDRTNAGAGYYGCMELSSNVSERGISIGAPSGRAYTGNHGDGNLSISGYQDVTSWPDPLTVTGIFFRGGAWHNSMSYSQLSDRILAESQNGIRNFGYGGRGVRTAQ